MRLSCLFKENIFTFVHKAKFNSMLVMEMPLKHVDSERLKWGRQKEDLLGKVGTVRKRGCDSQSEKVEFRSPKHL